MQKISILVKVNSGTWGKKYVEFGEGSSSFDIVDHVTFYRDYRIDKSECISAKFFPSQNSLFLRACLLQESGPRKLHYFEIEFLDPKELVIFSEHLKENGFSLDKKHEKFLVFVNPVSGKGKAEESGDI